MIGPLARLFCGHVLHNCDHEWDTAVTTVAQPLSDLPTLDTYSADDEMKFLMGVTTVLRVCKKGCGAQETFEMLGMPR